MYVLRTCSTNVHASFDGEESGRCVGQLTSHDAGFMRVPDLPRLLMDKKVLEIGNFLGGGR